LLSCENDLQRAFYEIESIKGGWSFRELKRQIESLLYERTGLAKNKEELLKELHQRVGKMQPSEWLQIAQKRVFAIWV
jgi:predicted nuclease of restriction endonuclease-like (RecB) superfamily